MTTEESWLDLLDYAINNPAGRQIGEGNFGYLDFVVDNQIAIALLLMRKIGFCG